MIPSRKAKYAAVGLCGVALFVCGLSTGYAVYAPKKPNADAAYKPEVIQKDGSRIVERKPQKSAKPQAEVPKGAKVDRMVQVQIKPDSLEPVSLEVLAVTMPDKSSRIVVKSQGGEFLSAVDIPVIGKQAQRELRWSAGLSYRMPGQTMGVYLDRDYGWLRLGAELFQEREPIIGVKRMAVSVRAGIRW